MPRVCDMTEATWEEQVGPVRETTCPHCGFTGAVSRRFARGHGMEIVAAREVIRCCQCDEMTERPCTLTLAANLER